MKQLYFLGLFCWVALFSFWGCSKNGGGDEPDKKAEIILPEESFQVNIEEGGTGSTVKFTAKTNWSASVAAFGSSEPLGSVATPSEVASETKAPASWLKIEPMSGPAGEVTLTITTPVYFADKERIAEVTLTAGSDTKSFLVFQWAVPPIVLTQLLYQFDALPKLVELHISRNTEDFSIQVAEGADWITPRPVAAGDYEPYFDVSGNPEMGFRRGVIRVTDNGSGLSQEVEVIQAPDPSTELIIADNAFRAYLLANFDRNKDGRITEMEAASVEEMNWNGVTFGSLDELVYFPSLGFLTCENASLPALDLTGNHNLHEFICTNTKVPSIDLSQNPNLGRTLVCLDNPELVSLKVGDTPLLEGIECQRNAKLATLSVGRTEKLTKINCFENALTSLDVSGATALRELRCQKNQLTQLDIAGCERLYTLYALENKLTSLSCAGLEELTSVNVSDNSIETLDVTGCKALINLNCQKNQLNDLFLNSCVALKEVLADENLLRQVDVVGCRVLHKLTLNLNDLSSLNLSGNPALYVLNCDNNVLGELDLSANTAIGYVDCSGNLLQSLVVNAPETLEAVRCSANPLTNLDFSGHAKLVQLWTFGQPLETLNVSGCAALWSLNVSNTSLTHLDLSDSPKLRPENVTLEGGLQTLKYYNSLCGGPDGWWGDRDPVTNKYPYPAITYAH